MGKLSGKAAIITGSTKGIGLGIARVFAREGAMLTVVSRGERGQEIIDELLALGAADAQFVRTDVRDSQQIQAMIAATVARFGRLDVLVNNAGYHISKGAEETSEEEWEFLIDTNLRSTFLCSKYALPHLKATRGAIINISSMVGLVGQPNAVAYSATKGGQIAMTKSMAIDLAPCGVRVNALCPGWITTPLVDDWFSQQPDEAAARSYIYGVHPMGRIGTIEECGRAALFLATDDASFVTGVALPLDGGVTLGY
ncbi:MAG: SDR family oxidoreductase [Chloroflexi bacterium]|nr:SDR family oxidoreductase [Chloroflexota bacterium]